MFVNPDWVRNLDDFRQSQPFEHVVIDNFFEPELALQLEAEFPTFEDNVWHHYNNAIEVKKACNNWNVFPEITYRTFAWLNSDEFVQILSGRLGIEGLSADPGLNGGGWHIHKKGGKLNTHLDYSVHPKLMRQRKLNLIVYLNSDWQDAWGGHLGLWRQHPSKRKPGELVHSLSPRFNRAVLFDTTQDSWHGLPAPLACPEGQTRRSLAVYYLVPAIEGVDPRGKALFAPTAEQETDVAVLDLIKVRSDVKGAEMVYRK